MITVLIIVISSMIIVASVWCDNDGNDDNSKVVVYGYVDTNNHNNIDNLMMKALLVGRIIMIRVTAVSSWFYCLAAGKQLLSVRYGKRKSLHLQQSGSASHWSLSEEVSILSLSETLQ